jgi:hypothetical protein
MKFIVGNSKYGSLPEHTTSIKILWRGGGGVGEMVSFVIGVPEQTGLALG